MKDLLEPVKLRGDLSVAITNVHTGRVTRQHIRNTITYAGMNSALYLWSQDSITASDYQIAALVPGKSPTPPTHGDLAVIDPITSGDWIALTGANRTVVPSTGELIITATLDTMHGNVSAPDALCEVGLVLGNGALFARQVHTAFQKTNAFTFTYTWRIAMTA